MVGRVSLMGMLFCLGNCRWVMGLDRPNLYLRVTERPQGPILHCFADLVRQKRRNGKCPSYKSHADVNVYKVYIIHKLLIPQVNTQ